MGSIGPFLLGNWITDTILIPVKIGIYFQPIYEAIIYGLVTAITYSFWPLSSIENVNSSELFRNETEANYKLPRFVYLASISGCILFLIALASYFTGSIKLTLWTACLLYTSPSPRDRQKSRMPSSA